jgi:anti-sigma-K factor RskA
LNKQEIISNGLLEAYVTGDLTKDESKEVETLIADDSDVKTEFYKIQKLYELLAFHQRIEPSPVLKRMVMEDPSVMMNINARVDRKGNSWNWMMAASVMLATFSTIAAFYFWSHWQASDAKLSAYILQNIEMAQNLNTVSNDLEAMRSDVAVFSGVDYQRIILDGTENAPGAKAVVYWNAAEGRVYLNSAKMNELPDDKQYQLWALKDGKPIDAGVFDPKDGAIQPMYEIESADAFAVTLEPIGGSAAPTLSTLQVIGKV